MTQPRSFFSSTRAILHVACVLTAGALITGCSQDAKQARHLKRGDAYFDKGQYREATIEYMNVLRNDRTNETAIVQSALAYFELGDISKAIAFLGAAVQLQPDNLDLRVRLGALCRAGRAFPQARDQALAILERDPANLDGLVLLADTAMEPADIEDALGRLEKQAAAAGDRSAFHQARANVLFKLQRFEEAEASYKRALDLAPDSASVHLALGNFYALRNDTVKAEAELARASDLAPPVSTIRVRYAMFLYAAGRRMEAKALLEEMLDQEPAFLPALAPMGDYALADGRLEDSEAIAVRILRKVPDHFGGQVLRARLMYARGEYADAIEALERLRNTYPKSGQVQAYLAGAYAREGKIDLARTAYREALRFNPRLTQAQLHLAELDLRTGNTTAALRSLNRYLDLYPNSHRALLLLSRAFMAVNKPDQAVAVLKKLEGAQPESPTAALLQGRILQGQGRTKEARAAYERALVRDPLMAIAISRLADLDIQAGRVDNAIGRVENAIARSPDAPDLHILLGSVHEQTGHLEAAEKAYRAGIDADPNRAGGYVVLARLLARDEDRSDEALRQAEEALKVREDNVVASMMAGMLYEQKRDYSQALEHYKHVLALRPDFAPALNNAAYLSAERLDDLDMGFAWARKARDISPNDPAAADTLGWIVYKRGEHRWGLALIREALERYADRAAVQYHLGMALAAVGDEPSAAAALTKALALDSEDLPEPERIRTLLALLNIPVGEVTEEHRPIMEAVLRADPMQASARMRQAVFLEGRDADDAREAYEGILASHPYYLPAALRLIDLYDGRLADPGTALITARAARDRHPGDPRVAQRVGELALQAGDYSWAYSLLREAVDALPDDASLRFHLALASLLQGHTEDAQRMVDGLPDAGFSEAEKAAQLRTLITAMRDGRASEETLAQARGMEEDDLLIIPARMAVARTLAESNAEAAVAMYEALLVEAPEFVPASVEAARLYAGVLHNDAKAMDLAMAARHQRDDDPEIAALLGRIVYRRGDFAWARRLFEESLPRAPARAENLYYLGLCCKELNDVTCAVEMLEKAIEIDPDAGFAQDARRALNEVRDRGAD